MFAFPSFDRYDDHHQDRGREDHEDDDHQGGVEKGYVFSNFLLSLEKSFSEKSKISVAKSQEI